MVVTTAVVDDPFCATVDDRLVAPVDETSVEALRELLEEPNELVDATADEISVAMLDDVLIPDDTLAEIAASIWLLEIEELK